MTSSSVPLCGQSLWPRHLLSYCLCISPTASTGPSPNTAFSRKPFLMHPPSSTTHWKVSTPSSLFHFDSTILIAAIPFSLIVTCMLIRQTAAECLKGRESRPLILYPVHLPRGLEQRELINGYIDQLFIHFRNMYMCPNIAGTTLGSEVNKTGKTVDSLASWSLPSRKWRQPYKQTIIVTLLVQS